MSEQPKPSEAKCPECEGRVREAVYKMVEALKRLLHNLTMDKPMSAAITDGHDALEEFREATDWERLHNQRLPRRKETTMTEREIVNAAYGLIQKGLTYGLYVASDRDTAIRVSAHFRCRLDELETAEPSLEESLNELRREFHQHSHNELEAKVRELRVELERLRNDCVNPRL